MEDGRSLSCLFILELISNLITSFQANLALLILQADYSRRRQNWHYQVTFANGIKRHTHTRRTLITTVWLSRGVKWVIVLNMTLSYHSEHVCVKHAQSGKLSFSNRFIVYVCTGENDAKTLRVDSNFFENEEKKLRFQTNTDTCGQGLIVFLRAADWPTVNFLGMYCYFPEIRLVNFV